MTTRLPPLPALLLTLSLLLSGCAGMGERLGGRMFGPSGGLSKEEVEFLERHERGSPAEAPRTAKSADVASTAPGTRTAAPAPASVVTAPPRPVAPARLPGNEVRVGEPGAPLPPIDEVYSLSRPVATVATPQDLWVRMQRGFVMPGLDNDLVRQHERAYSSRPDYMQRMVERSRKYLFHIVDELEERNMPLELALLPFIESAFNPNAVSSARAAGMWQFIPSTGRVYDLKQNMFRDDRRDVLASTRAALDYLQKLHGMFGDWHLALAAYNWGEGSVQRAIAHNKRRGLGTAYTDLNMPNETRHYVPKLQAVKNIVAAPAKFGVVLPVIENHPYFQSVTITRDIDVATAARLADVSLEDFKSLNPSANRPVILAAGTPQILLPWDNAALFERRLSYSKKAQLASWTAWVAPSTMKPSEAAQRVGMTEQSLRSVNNIPPRTIIKAGSTLLVPRSGKNLADVSEHLADNAQLALAPDTPPLRRTVLKAGRNDSVVSVARRYRLSVARVAEWNQTSASTRFRPGQNIVVYLPTRPAATRAVARPAAKPVVKPAAKAATGATRPAAPAANRKAPASKATVKPKVAT